MLLPEEVSIVRRDPAIPALALLLDCEEVVTTLDSIVPASGIENAKAWCINYRPGERCLVGYQLSFSGKEHVAYIKAYAGDAETKLQMARAQSNGSRSPGFKALVLDEFNAVLYLFPLDYELRTQRILEYPEKCGELLKDLFGEQHGFANGTLHQLKYKPEKRYVARLDSDGQPQALIKLFRADKYEKAKRMLQASPSPGSTRTADWLGYSDQCCAIAYEWLRGASLQQIILSQDLPEREKLAAVEMTGAALYRLHMQKPNSLSQLPGGTVKQLRDSEMAISRVCPDLKERVNQLVNYIAGHLEAAFPARVIHGDFHQEQVLCSGGAATIIDLDQARLGNPAEDLGLFIAKLEIGGLRNKIGQHDIESVRNALLEGYRRSGGTLSDASIRLYTAVGLLSLATGPFRNRKPEWPKLMKAILVHAGVIVERHSRETSVRVPVRRLSCDGPG